mgnify:FL=1
MKPILALRDQDTLLKDIKSLKEVIWINENYTKFKDVEEELPISYKDVLDAEKRLNRFQPFIKKAFPEIIDGIIESPLTEIHHMKDRMEKDYGEGIEGKLLLKRDDLLPIAGSIKARGGIYEVLKRAETLAIDKVILSM